MIEALKLVAQMFFAGGLIFMAALFLRSLFATQAIPQDEIDAEARRLIVEHGDGAVEAAESQLLRSQWAKGRNDNRERAELVLKAVQMSLRIKR